MVWGAYGVELASKIRLELKRLERCGKLVWSSIKHNKTAPVSKAKISHNTLSNKQSDIQFEEKQQKKKINKKKRGQRRTVSPD